MLRTWLWLRRWGGWVITGILGAVTFVFYLLLPKKKKEEPVEPEHTTEEKANERAKAADEMVTEHAAEEEARVKSNADVAWLDSIAKAEEIVDLTKDNPDATSRFLEHVEKEMRRR